MQEVLTWFVDLPVLTQLIILYFVGINIVTFFYFGIDKIKSQFGYQRISEKQLWFLTLIGGSVGALAGMEFFRHKTKKTSFQAVIVFIILLQIAVLILLTQ